jgi:trans-aconitate methyltransferase
VRGSLFNSAYYDRFYGERPVRSESEVVDLASAVHGMVSWWGAPPRSVLEVGAGPGYWSRWYRANHPRVRVVSTDVSEHACDRYDHQRRDISEWSPKRPSDLVICVDVLQYLDDVRAARALRNLTTATRTVLYFDVLTKYDARHTVDREHSDLDAFLRPGDWYRRRLTRGFVHAGSGLWVRRTSGIVLHELERSR